MDPVKEILAKKKVESKAVPSAPSSKTPAALVAKPVQSVPAAASEDCPKPRPRPCQKMPPPIASSSRLSQKSISTALRQYLISSHLGISSSYPSSFVCSTMSSHSRAFKLMCAPSLSHVISVSLLFFC
jgi:hypothetical protein